MNCPPGSNGLVLASPTDNSVFDCDGYNVIVNAATLDFSGSSIVGAVLVSLDDIIITSCQISGFSFGIRSSRANGFKILEVNSRDNGEGRVPLDTLGLFVADSLFKAKW